MTLPQSRSSDRLGAPLLALCLSYVWLVLNAEIGWLRGAIVLADLAVAALPFTIVLRRVTGRLGFAECITSAGIGLATLGGLGMVLIRIGLPDYTAEIILLAAAGLLLALAFGRNTTDSDESSTGVVGLGWRIAAIVALALPLSYVFFCAWIGGRGPVPAFMLSADISTDLSMIQALLASRQMPPMLLVFAGGSMGYHYGSLEATAHLIRLSGIVPHAALLYVALPVFWSSAAASAWLIARRLTAQGTAGTGAALAAACGVLAVCLFLSHDMIEASFKTVKMIGLWLTGHPLDQKPFMKIGPTHATVASGIAMAWASFMLLAHWQRRAARGLVAVIVGLMAILDAFFFASAGLVLGAWSLRAAWTQRNPLLIAAPAAALILALALQRITGSTEAGYSISLAFFENDYVNRFAFGTLRHCAALIAIIAFACLLPGSAKVRRLALGIAVIAVVLFCITNFTVMRYAGQQETNFNWFRWLFIVPLLLGIGAAASMPAILGQSRAWPKYALAVLLLLAVPLQLLRYPVTGIQTLAAPTLRGDETLDTATLADALSHIPVTGSLVVVSDLRYPSTDAPDNLPIVAALYGHRCYVCVAWPDSTWDAEMKQRRADIAVLQTDPWQPQVVALARQHGWTHWLLRKNSPHAANIPLTLVYENQDYAVYKF